MALISKQKYDATQIQKLAELVRIYHEKGQPFDYEILVDGLKVVRRTNDPEMFFIFENFVTPESKSLEILFYVGNSNVNEKRMFTFVDDPEEKGLSGVEVDARIQEQVEKQKKEWEHAQLKQENQQLKAEVDELEKDVERLEKEKQELLDGQSPLQGVLGELGSSFVESFLRRNPQILKGLPGGAALAGLIENDNQRKEQDEGSSPETEVSFRPKADGPSLSGEDQAAIEFVNQMKSKFSADEFSKVLLILETLAEDKDKIDLILNHINIKRSQP